jgi:hypothetical protein
MRGNSSDICPARRQGKEESSFCEQKEAKKLFPTGLGDAAGTVPKRMKFFARFFSKKRRFLHLSPASSPARSRCGRAP